jgi:hypothetical protein
MVTFMGRNAGHDCEHFSSEQATPAAGMRAVRKINQAAAIFEGRVASRGKERTAAKESTNPGEQSGPSPRLRPPK